MHWNAWFETHVYIRDQHLQTLPYILVRMINQGLAEEQLRAQGHILAFGAQGGSTVTGNSIRMATMIVAVTPIMLVYPFLQKYFVKGIMLGAVKG
jgi:putative aldouronate transport system permease protein